MCRLGYLTENERGVIGRQSHTPRQPLLYILRASNTHDELLLAHRDVREVLGRSLYPREHLRYHG